MSGESLRNPRLAGPFRGSSAAGHVTRSVASGVNGSSIRSATDPRPGRPRRHLLTPDALPRSEQPGLGRHLIDFLTMSAQKDYSWLGLRTERPSLELNPGSKAWRGQ